MITVFPARVVHTMDRSRPTAEAVAVRDGRVLGVGSVDELRGWGDVAIDKTFSDKVLLPGFVEAHSHSAEGALWQYTYCGYFGRRGPDGREWPGCTSIDQVLQRLRRAEAELDDPHTPLCAWGLDPIYFAGERLVGRHLDQVSSTRPIFVVHASLHLATVNSALMKLERIDEDTLMDGVPKGADGLPIGELQEPPAMALAGASFRHLFRGLGADQGIWNFGKLARNAGVTTLTDLGTASIASDRLVERWQRVVNDEAFPARVSLFHQPGAEVDDAAVGMVVERRSQSTDKLRMGHVKLILDGSIQGFTARLRPPGYLGDRPNGLWLIPPEQVVDRLGAFHGAGLTVHAHCNGDQAVDVFLDAVETVLAEAPQFDHRHTVQHCQLTTPAQYRRIAALGVSANLFANHTFYWGDQHRDITVGPDRAARMNAAATALGQGVSLSMHSDAPVTPISSLHVAWCAVNRVTATGMVLGHEERISIEEALAAVTVGAAYQLKMDDEVGSIAPNTWADFAVLEDDPFTVHPAELRDVPVWGTVLAGMPDRPAEMQSPIPLTVIGGYLGAGKTTLVNDVLRHPGTRRYGVVVNDIGQVAIDTALVETADENMVTLSNGCVCCSLTDGFAAALLALGEPQRGLDHVLVEVSGVGDPWKVAQWGRTPGFELDAVVVLADVEAVRTQAVDRYVGETVAAQLQSADLVVLSKVDVAPALVDEVTAWIGGLTDAPVIAHPRGSRSVVDLVVAVHGGARRALGVTAPVGEPHVDHVTRVLSEPEALARTDWFAWLGQAPAGVVRVKGVVPSRAGELVVVQLAGKRTEVSRWRGEPMPPVLVAVATPAVDEADLDAWLAQR